MTDDDIEADLAAGAVELRRNAPFPIGRAPEIGGDVDHRDEAARAGGGCVDLCHSSSPAWWACEIIQLARFSQRHFGADRRRLSEMTFLRIVISLYLISTTLADL